MDDTPSVPNPSAYPMSLVVVSLALIVLAGVLVIRFATHAKTDWRATLYLAAAAVAVAGGLTAILSPRLQDVPSQVVAAVFGGLTVVGGGIAFGMFYLAGGREPDYVPEDE